MKKKQKLVLKAKSIYEEIRNNVAKLTKKEISKCKKMLIVNVFLFSIEVFQ